LQNDEEDIPTVIAKKTKKKSKGDRPETNCQQMGGEIF